VKNVSLAGRLRSLFIPNSEMGMGSARGPRAGLGGSPKPSSHLLCPILARESLWDEIFGEPPKTARQRRALPVRLRRTRLRLRNSGLTSTKNQAGLMAGLIC
jgi:hypothetical protein